MRKEERERIAELDRIVNKIDQLPDQVGMPDNRPSKHIARLYARLTKSIIEYNISADWSNKILIWLTAVIAVLTLVLLFR